MKQAIIVLPYNDETKAALIENSETICWAAKAHCIFFADFWPNMKWTDKYALALVNLGNPEIFKEGSWYNLVVLK